AGARQGAAEVPFRPGGVGRARYLPEADGGGVVAGYECSTGLRPMVRLAGVPVVGGVLLPAADPARVGTAPAGAAALAAWLEGRTRGERDESEAAGSRKARGARCLCGRNERRTERRYPTGLAHRGQHRLRHRALPPNGVGPWFGAGRERGGGGLDRLRRERRHGTADRKSV